MRSARIGSVWSASAVAVLLAFVSAGCGGGKKAKTSAQRAPTVLALTIAESGKRVAYTAAPASVTGGLVTVQLNNTGKTPHGAQLIRLEGGHTIEQALQILSGESNKTPSWIHAEGGVGAAGPGATGTATVNLPPGSYGVVDVAGARSGEGPPAAASLTVTPGTEGALASTGTTITAAAPSKDHYKWQISGTLKTGSNQITLVSKGKDTLHDLSVGRITSNVPIARIVKDLQSNGPPPSYVDRTAQFGTSALDNGKSENTQLVFSKPGTYVFICHLHDRDGGKPHFAEGLITTVTVH